jgi:hypothetical protein
MLHREKVNDQFPSTNNQIIAEAPMTEMGKIKLMKSLLDHWIFGDWSLFGIWKLVIGI